MTSEICRQQLNKLNRQLYTGACMVLSGGEWNGRVENHILDTTLSQTMNERIIIIMILTVIELTGVTLAQLVKAAVGQADVQRFEPHLGHNWLSCGVFLVKSRHFGLPLAQTIRPKLAISLSAGGSVAIQTWSIYKVYT